MNGSLAVGKAILTAKEAAPALQKLKRATRDMEALFLKDLLSIMRRSLPKPPFGEAPGKAIYEDLFDGAVADAAAKSGRFGIGAALYQRLSPSVAREAAQRARSLLAGTLFDTDRAKTQGVPVDSNSRLDIKG